ncbi:PiggyBac transposable element-derived protein 4, partial [Trichinella sp. T6]
MQIYTGKPSSGTREKNQGMRVVLDMNLTLVGTVKKNKPELPRELLQLQGRKLNSSTFAFSEDCTIESYRPKKNKNVIVLSTMHNDNQVCDGKGSKPDIILHYNIAKGGVDNLDKMTSTYSCQRMTARWSLVIFCNIIDVSAYNAYVLWTEKHPAWNARRLHKRRLFLEELGKALVQLEMMRRKTLPRTAAAKSAELRFVTPVRCCIRDLLHLYYCVGKFLRSVSKLMTCTTQFEFPYCSVRNNTDPVGVTRPRGGTRKSRVGKNNTRAPPARSLSEHLAAPSRGQKGLLLRPDLSAFARQLRARHKGGSGQTKGHGS